MSKQPTSQDTTGPAGDEWVPLYSTWQHGGWYVHNVRYPTGACGCVSRNFPDRKWRIVAQTAVMDLSSVPTYKSRDDAAHAELELAALAHGLAPTSPGNVFRPEDYPETRDEIAAMTAEVEHLLGVCKVDGLIRSWEVPESRIPMWRVRLTNGRGLDLVNPREGLVFCQGLLSAQHSYRSGVNWRPHL